MPRCARRCSTPASPTEVAARRRACGSGRSGSPGRWMPMAPAPSPAGLEEVLVVEDRRPFLEPQLRDALYARGDPPAHHRQDRRRGAPAAVRPDRAGRRARCCARSPPACRRGLRTEQLMPPASPRWTRWPGCQPAPVALTAAPISARAARTTPPPGCRRAAAPWPASAATTWRPAWTAPPRCSPRWAARACPGSARRPSSRTRHVFANIGDGTYAHSGSLADPRRPSPPGANMTFKILVNGAVAMTGGQTPEAEIGVPAHRGADGRRGRRARSSSSPTTPTATRATR